MWNQYNKTPYKEIEYSVIDFDILVKKTKIIKVLAGEEEKNSIDIIGYETKFNDFEIAHLMEQINKCYSDSIESQDFIRAIADNQFNYSKVFFQWRFMIFFMFYVIPFLL